MKVHLFEKHSKTCKNVGLKIEVEQLPNRLLITSDQNVSSICYSNKTGNSEYYVRVDIRLYPEKLALYKDYTCNSGKLTGIYQKTALKTKNIIKSDHSPTTDNIDISEFNIQCPNKFNGFVKFQTGVYKYVQPAPDSMHRVFWELLEFNNDILNPTRDYQKYMANKYDKIISNKSMVGYILEYIPYIG